MNDEINSIFKFFNNINFNFINTIIEKFLLDIFITDDLNDNDKKIVYIIINNLKKSDYREIKLLFIINFIFSIKRIAEYKESDGKNNFYKVAANKFIAYIVSRILGDYFTINFREEECNIIENILNSCSNDFNSKLKYYIIRMVENNDDNDISILYLYQNSFDNILLLYKKFISVVYDYIKIVNNIVSLYIIPLTIDEQLSVLTYVKIFLINIYILLLFNFTYKKCKIDYHKNENDTPEEKLEIIFDNIYKIIEKNTLRQELKVVNETLFKNIILKGGNKKYFFTKLTEQRIKQTKMYQLFETVISIAVDNLTILVLTDKMRTYFEAYANSMTDFKINLKETNNFVDILNVKPYYSSNIIPWNFNDTSENVFVLKNITLEYNSKDNVTSVVFQNVNLEFNNGKSHFIFGDSGCGKTTLLYALMKRIKIKDGDIYFLGMHDKYTYFSIRKYLTYITSANTLFIKSLFYNIVYGINKNALKLKKNEIMEEITKYMNIFNLNKYTPVIKKKNVNELSTGQKQRVVIISLFIDIIFNHKKIILLDEVTSNVDSEMEEIIFQELKKLQEIYNFTLFYISHNLVNKKYSDYNYRIDPHTRSIHKEATITPTEKNNETN
jgi:zinc transport system ATP-binding protein